MLYSDLALLPIVLATALLQGFPLLAPVHNSSSTEPQGRLVGLPVNLGSVLSWHCPDQAGERCSCPSYLHMAMLAAEQSPDILDCSPNPAGFHRAGFFPAKRRDYYPDEEKKRVPACCWLIKQHFQDQRVKWVVLCGVNLPKITNSLTTQSIFSALQEDQ